MKELLELGFSGTVQRVAQEHDLKSISRCNGSGPGSRLPIIFTFDVVTLCRAQYDQRNKTFVVGM